MSDLVSFMDDLGYQNCLTLLQTGNVIFEAGETVSALEPHLKAQAKSKLNLSTEFFIRTGKEMEDIIAKNPFPDFAKEDPSHLVVLFANGHPNTDQQANLRAAIKGRETFKCLGNNLYFTYPDGIGNSKLTLAVIEKHLGVKCTGRNWNTVQKVLAKLA